MNYEKLKSYRRMAGYSQTLMAKQANMTQATYSRKENGESDFTSKEINKVVDILFNKLNPMFPDIDKQTIIKNFFT